MACAEPVLPPSGRLSVEVAYSPAARQVQRWVVSLVAGATVADALRASGIGQCDPQLDWTREPLGIWGRMVQPDDAVQDGDRIEVCRALRVDPKEARRLRYRAQGERGRGTRRKVVIGPDGSPSG